MFKKVSGVLFAFLIIAQSMVNVGLFAYYHLNKKMIAAQFCINKSNPQMHCNGHCYLSKQLKKAEENEKQQSQSFREKDEQPVTFNEHLAALYTPSLRVIGLMKQFLNHKLRSSFSDIAPPPKTEA